MQDRTRLFTHVEASDLIPVLRPMLHSIQAAKRELDEVRKTLEPYTAAMRTNGHATSAARIETRLEELTASLRASVAEIHGLGVEVKDLDMGLVDFPSERDGRIVYLCWMVDEPRIDYWHELDTGIAGRERL